MSKHTPGPWHISELYSTSAYIDDNFGSDGGRDYMLATVEHGDPEELRANANLIAAAPDLLDALESLAVDYHRKDGLGFDLLASTKMFAAIRKAKGESQ